jgi:hypothetical protein
MDHGPAVGRRRRCWLCRGGASVNPDLAAVSRPEGVDGTVRVGALIGVCAEEISQSLAEGSVDAWRPDGVLVSECRREARYRHSGCYSTAHHPTPRIEVLSRPAALSSSLCLADELHVGVLNAVMDHFDEMAGAIGRFSSRRALTRLLDAHDSPLTRGWSRFPNRGCDIDRFHGAATAVVLDAVAGMQLFDDLAEARVGEGIGEEDEAA